MDRSLEMLVGLLGVLKAGGAYVPLEPGTPPHRLAYILENTGASAVLKRSNLDFGDVVKCTVMLDNMTDWPAFNKVYVTYFPDGKFPARSAFGADGLAMGALLEVECWAFAGKR